MLGLVAVQGTRQCSIEAVSIANYICRREVSIGQLLIDRRLPEHDSVAVHRRRLSCDVLEDGAAPWLRPEPFLKATNKAWKQH